MATWLSLVDYSNKYKVSISTLRRKIKIEDVPFRLESGKYYIIDEPITAMAASSGNQLELEKTPAPVPAPAEKAAAPATTLTAPRREIEIPDFEAARAPTNDFEQWDGRECISYPIVKTNLQHNQQADNLRKCENLNYEFGSSRTTTCVKVDGKSQPLRASNVGPACNALAYQ